MENFKVSVIIPVFNAEKYLRNAVESAVNLPEVGEVILVEDGSPDNALRLCRELEIEYKKVKLYQHPNGENRGAGASRNLGIKKSNYNYIAFLDADDWYLPIRFKAEVNLFKEPEIDGVYGCTQSFLEKDGDLMPLEEYSTVNQKMDSHDLIKNLFRGKNTGYFTTNAITVKKEFLLELGLFDESLRLHQDSHLYHRMLWNGNVVPGEIEQPICTRRKHPNNRISTKNHQSKKLYFRALFYSYENDKPKIPGLYKLLFDKYISTYSQNRLKRSFIRLLNFIAKPNRFYKYYFG